MHTFQIRNISLKGVLEMKEGIETVGSRQEGFERRIGVFHFRIGFILEGGKAADQDAERLDLVFEGIGSVRFLEIDVG